MTAGNNEDICCPPFDRLPWDETYHTWKEKKFIKDEVRQILHMPLNMGKVIKRMDEKVRLAGALPDIKDSLLLSYDPSPWKSELYYAVSKFVPGGDTKNVTISGNFISKVFEGPYNHIPKWIKEMEAFVKDQGHQVKKYYFYYTTCPKCAKKYGHNYVVILAEI